MVLALEAGAGLAVAPLPSSQAVAAAPGLAAVTGFAWSVAGDPIADATVRLRNILTGIIVATAVTNRNGEFTFENVPGGATYVVELVNERGAVRAVGHQFTAAPGDTVATFVRLGVPAPWLTGVFGSAAALVVSAAATIGIPASVPPEQPISPIR